MSGDVLDQRACEVRMDGEVLVYHYRDAAAVELQDAVEIVGLGGSLTPTPIPTLVDMRGIRSISGEARAYFSGDENQRVSSRVALLAGNAVSRMIGNFFLGLNRPTVPVRLFRKREDALTWLMTET